MDEMYDSGKSVKMNQLDNLIKGVQSNIFVNELKVRFFKRQLNTSKGDQIMDLNKQIMAIENNLKIDRDYLKFLVEILDEMLKPDMPRS